MHGQVWRELSLVLVSMSRPSLNRPWHDLEAIKLSQILILELQLHQHLLTNPRMRESPGIKSVWFLPRTRDHPFIAAISLGDIIETPWKPEEAVNHDPPPVIDPERLRHREEKSWSWSRESERSVSGGLFASFLEFLGLGGDLEGGTERLHADTYTVERMVTDEFIPDQPYLKQCIQDPGVRSKFIGPARKSHIYMVTGLKLAYGATKVREVMKKKSVHAQFGVDATLAGVPISVGPKGHWESGVAERSEANEADFVFGFKLRKLRYKKGEVFHKEYDRGARYGVDQDGGMGEIVEELDAADFDVEDVESASSEEFRMKSKDIMSMEAGEEIVRICLPVPV